MSSFKRYLIILLYDAFVIILSLYLALILRFDGSIPEVYLQSYLNLLPLFLLAHLFSSYLLSLQKRLWRYASIKELLAIIYAVSLGTILSIAINYFLQYTLPRSFYIISWGLIIAGIGSSRLAWRIYREGIKKGNISLGSHPALIIGAGSAGAMVIKELMHNNEKNLHVVGFVDDDIFKQQTKLYGIPVVGTREEIPELIKKYKVEEIIIAIPSASGKTIREILKICSTTSTKISTLPGIYELIEGTVTVNQIREVNLEDLLRREPVKVDLSEIAQYLHDKRVLVTGAGGSIGSELCRQVASFLPQNLVLLGHDEGPIFNIERELKEKYPEVPTVPIIGDVKNIDKIDLIFRRYHPDVVFHAAAHKHVPLMEINPSEAVKNNIFGTRNVAEAADRFNSDIFVLVSTDKAVNPSSVMGVTKHVAEIIVQNMFKHSKTRFVAVRFGNVLGSSDSVIPIFQEQIAKGQPLTVTHPEMTRYFMTIPEAVQLVIQTGAMASGGEIFVLDMGEPLKILDLAKDMIRLSGFSEEEVPIKITGIRPGEKLYEELLTDEEGIVASKHQRIFVTSPMQVNERKLKILLAELYNCATGTLNREAILAALKAIVPSYGVEYDERVG
ncbi:MAG: polysaccharide biosynthesis protein [Firmicutes bacterium HGW-Firmicutes-12]|nr:MAG: polysaccharide biosynthesis protein [Firmicutes bacterium HGW-Firmicutes-12]